LLRLTILVLYEAMRNGATHSASSGSRLGEKTSGSSLRFGSASRWGLSAYGSASTARSRRSWRTVSTWRRAEFGLQRLELRSTPAAQGDPGAGRGGGGQVMGRQPANEVGRPERAEVVVPLGHDGRLDASVVRPDRRSDGGSARQQ
jgi:hypothetical protein